MQILSVPRGVFRNEVGGSKYNPPTLHQIMLSPPAGKKIPKIRKMSRIFLIFPFSFLSSFFSFLKILKTFLPQMSFTAYKMCVFGLLARIILFASSRETLSVQKLYLWLRCLSAGLFYPFCGFMPCMDSLSLFFFLFSFFSLCIWGDVVWKMHGFYIKW